MPSTPEAKASAWITTVSWLVVKKMRKIRLRDKIIKFLQIYKWLNKTTTSSSSYLAQSKKKKGKMMALLEI